MNLDDMKEFIVLLVLVALIGAAVAIALVDFRGNLDLASASATGNVTASTTTVTPANISSGGILNSVSTVCIWLTSGTCTKITIGSEANASTGIDGSGRITITGNYSGNATQVNYSWSGREASLNITTQGILGTKNATSYLDTTGTILGIAVLIGIVVLAFAFMRR